MQTPNTLTHLSPNARITFAVMLHLNNLWLKAIDARRPSYVGFIPTEGATRRIPSFYTNAGGYTFQNYHVSKAGLDELAAAGLVLFAARPGDNVLRYETAYLPGYY